MEMMHTIFKRNRLVHFIVYGLLLLVCIQGSLVAQEPFKKYTVKNDRMYIELDREIRESALDSFIMQYKLYELALKRFIKNNYRDSILIAGWKIEVYNKRLVAISKPLLAIENFNNPADRILFTEKHPTFAERFPAVDNGIVFGYNKFRNKEPFDVTGDIVTFFLRNHNNARRVMLAGSFNDWDPDALAMTKTDSGWIARIPLKPGKYWYKFIADGNWMVDRDNTQSENDGEGNTNSIFFVPNHTFTLNGFTNARRVYLAGSFNSWRPRELPMTKTATGWQFPMYLSEGTHTYKFIVNGDWYTDEANKERLPDGHGGYNSVIRLGKPHLFTLKGYTNAKKVELAGSFNDWKYGELYMRKTATGWELPYTLGPGNYEYKFIVDGKWISDPANPLSPNVQSGNSFLVIEPNYTFRLKGYSNAKNVYLAGEFNNWNPKAFAMKREGDEWVFSVYLSIGKHLYKFIVDDKWILDPGNKLWEQNEYGTGNSLIWIGR